MTLKDTAGRTLVSCRDAAELYGCSMRYLRKLAEDNRVWHATVAGGYVFDAAEIKALSKRNAKGRHRKRSEGFTAG